MDTLQPISSAQAARAFLEVKDERFVSALKMQKLVYIAHEDHIVQTAKGFISDPVEAWEGGPVFPALHRIIGNSEELSADVGELRGIERPDEDVLRHIGRIWDHLKERSGPGLSKDTHDKDSPWHMAMNPPRDFFQKLTGWKPVRPVIKDALIRRFCWESGLWRFQDV